ncbi:hypothetical protein Tco_0262613 [Tanacetum coccineum]
MIGSLLYLMASRPDIMFSVCLCTRFQEDTKTSHLEAEIMWTKDTIWGYSRTFNGDVCLTSCQCSIQCRDNLITSSEVLDRTKYRGMIGSLLYLMASRPDIMFSVCLCTRFQEDTKTSHLEAVKRGHRDHVPACLCHMLYSIETSTKYNLAFFILKRMEIIRNTPQANLPYGMLLTRLFTHIVSNFPELSNDCYILCDRVMHPLAPHYERKMRSNHGTKRCCSSNPSSSSNVLDHPSSFHHVYENDEESFHFNTPLPSQLINSLSNIDPRVFENPPHENQTMHTYQTEILNHQSQYRDEHRKGLRSIERALKNAIKGSKK